MMIGWLIVDRMGCGVYRCLIPALGLKEQSQGALDSEFIDREHCGPQKDGTLPLHLLDGIDVVVLQRPGHPLMRQWVAEIRRRGLPLFLELDDDIWHIARHNPAYDFWSDPKTLGVLREGLMAADQILVSTEPLAEEIQKRTGRRPRDFTVCPNHLHPAVWGPDLLATMPAKPCPHGRVVLGWQGSPTHDVDFTVVLPALRQILDRYPQVAVRFMGCVPQSVRGAIPPARFEWMKGVSFEQYPLTLKLASFDVMLAPLTPSRFNDCKSNIRWLEAGALGLPTVASNWGPYARSIAHGDTGWLAKTTADWVAGLSMLIEDADARRAMGQRTHQHVWAAWGSARVQAWQGVLQGASVCG